MKKELTITEEIQLLLLVGEVRMRILKYNMSKFIFHKNYKYRIMYNHLF